MESKPLQTLTLNSGVDQEGGSIPAVPASRKPMIVGIYGVSGCGKTYVLSELRRLMPDDDYTYYEGSQMIDDVTPGGLQAFHNMTGPEKMHWRQAAIRKISLAHADGKRKALVTGHYMLWQELEGFQERLWTQADLDTYTHILYLDTPAEIIAEQRKTDLERDRTWLSSDHLKTWQDIEKMELRRHCYDHGILFSLIPHGPARLERLIALITNLDKQSETASLATTILELDKLFAQDLDSVQTMIVMDADRTLTQFDTGKLFWAEAMSTQSFPQGIDPLKVIFSSPLGYSHTAFSQAALLYRECFTDDVFEAICTRVASKTSMYPQFVSLLRVLSRQPSVGLILVTCGLYQIWHKVLRHEGLDQNIKLIGAGRAPHDHIITARAKAEIVMQLKQANKQVVAIGDSILDLDMFHAADRAVVLVGHENTRSKTMDTALNTAITKRGLKACQVILPSTASPRLDGGTLPILKLNCSDFIEPLLPIGYHMREELDFITPTQTPAAQVLMTATRDAGNNGPGLREAHRRVGFYLALQFCTTLIGLETYPIKHVQDRFVDGHRLYHEEQTLIIALMRGGEPMAFGVNDVFTKAAFLHAKYPGDVKPAYLEDRVTIILVDSVINTGKSIIEFVRHISTIHATVHIVIMTGVAQIDSINKIRELQRSIKYNKISLVALRISENKFTGRGTTDTGNRLFNTTTMP